VPALLFKLQTYFEVIYIGDSIFKGGDWNIGECHTVTSLLHFSLLTIKFLTQDVVALLFLKMDLKTTVTKSATGPLSSGLRLKKITQTL
jgi:hypothetical protein